jgi:hypothetical protein
MVSSIGRLRLFLAAGIVVALLPLGVAEAKDWKYGDHGQCPGTWDAKEGKAPTVNRKASDPDGLYRCCCNYQE